MTDQTTRLYQAQQIKTIEQLAVPQYAVSEFELMESAGLAAFHLLQHCWPDARTLGVFCGKGNNGGDGYVVARLAKQAGWKVMVCQVGEGTGEPVAAEKARLACQAAGVEIKPFEHLWQQPFQADVIVDALLGIGIKGEVKGSYATVIAAINAAQKPVLSIDVPSGIDADTGRVCGVAVQANVTLTFMALKRGLYTGAAPQYCGDLHYDGLLPAIETLLDEVPASAVLLHLSALLQYLAPRKRDANKGNFGHVLIMGGNRGMVGAARMAGEAAARVGAGLVSLATWPEHAAYIAAARPELMCHGVTSPADCGALLARASVLVIGPGLGQDSWAQQLWTLGLSAAQLKILDADALNLLAKNPCKRDDWILTPHPGEAARLLNCSVADIQADRFKAAAELAERYGGVIVLKGAGTLVQSSARVGVCALGNPGMATGGMGDVLSGVLGGLVAQGLPLENAAQLGVVLHAEAGDKVAREQGERGMLALDLMRVLRMLVNEEGNSSPK
ncbi:MAG TPA: NAD(P)H-hydrate dehydratase [Gammaproteobacteria bacterium]|nr:NAD(P)H-hydrate dehydratase [Gammaproteobacteria bacterium]